VVNTAAIANIDFAEQNPALAQAVNVTGAGNIARCCAEADARYVFFSSDAVFDGINGGYREDSPKNPVNHYGKTKSDAEDVVHAILPSAIILRISLVIGFSSTGGNSFLGGMEKALQSGKTLACPQREVRTPIDVLTLCESIMELMDSHFAGVIHLGATDSVDRLSLSRMAAQGMGLDTALLVPAGPPEAARARRHEKGVLDVSLARQMLTTPMLSTRDGIARALTTRP